MLKMPVGSGRRVTHNPFVFYLNGPFESYTDGNMTPMQLVQAVADATGLPEETIVQHDRNLLVAGLRTKGGRGSSAAKVTYLDAARLLTASLGALRVKYSAETVREHEATAVDLSRSDLSRLELLKKIPALWRLNLDHGFVSMVAALIEASADKSICEYLEGKSLWPPVRISVSYPWTEPQIIFYDDHPDFGDGKIVARFGYRPSLSGKHTPLAWKDDRSEYDAWWEIESAARATANFSEPGFDVICVKQTRTIEGHSLQVLGQAFREDGVTVSPPPKKKRART